MMASPSALIKMAVKPQDKFEPERFGNDVTMLYMVKMFSWRFMFV